MRAVIVSAAGVILRTITASQENIAIQAGVGETALVLTSSAAGFIDDANVQVTAGAFAPVGAYAGDLPDSDLVAP